MKNVWFIVASDDLRTCDTSKMDLFAKVVYSLKSLTILTRRSIAGPEFASDIPNGRKKHKSEN